MSATHIASGTARLNVPTGYIGGFFTRFWCVFQERRERHKLRAVLHGLDDAVFKDIGISRGDIEHVVLNRSVEPRAAAVR